MMRKMTVLHINDVESGFVNLPYDVDYSKQLLCLLGEAKELRETVYFMTDSNYIVEIDKGIDLKENNIVATIEAGATVHDMYYVEDGLFSERVYEFAQEGNLLGFWDTVEWEEDHGIIFKEESDARRYQQFLDLLEFDNSFENPIITKDSAINLIKNTSSKHIASRLLEKQKYKWNGSFCYLDLYTGIVRTSEYREDDYLQNLSPHEILLARLSKDYNRESFRRRIVEMNNENIIKEFDIDHLTSIIQLENFMKRLEKFYDEEIYDY